MLTLRPPFTGETREQVINKICDAQPTRPRQLDRRIPLDLETICLRAIEKEPSQRYPSAEAMEQDLQRFAEDRPILTRRTSRVTKAVKWARRHKAASAAIAASVVVVLLAAGLAANITANRHKEAAKRLEDAYDHLVHVDYHRADLAMPDVERAEQLGADAARLDFVRAVAGMKDSDRMPSIERFEAVLAEEPENVEALYALAFMYWETGQRAAWQEAIERAESLGGADTAEEWFFHGLAMHQADPADAIESFKQARQLRSAHGQFYPQATLHLARTYNQLLYTERGIEAYAEAESALHQLIDSGIYGAYAYYLISISHRYAGEIYQGYGPGAAEKAAEHFDQALEWARRGAEVQPESDRPATAEAETFESMGDYDAAVEARTRAISLADREIERYEGVYYRWRLRYWQGDLDGALEDLTEFAPCSFSSRFNTHLYPILIHAEAGDLDQAVELARDLSQSEPESAQATLLSAACLRLLNRPAEADEVLDKAADNVDFTAGLVAPQSENWMRALHAFARGEETLDNLLALADEVDESRKLKGEANFYAGVLALADGDRSVAEERFLDAYRAFDSETRYTYVAKVLLRKLQREPTWPPWIEVRGGQVVGIGRGNPGDGGLEAAYQTGEEDL